jgi:hypothetical protein
MKFSILTAHHWRLMLSSIVAFFCALTVAGCGGATGSSSSNTPGLTLTLINASGSTVTNMVVGTSYTLVATATQTGGSAANVVVTFTAGSLATLTPTTGTALTNSSGVATMVLVPTTAGASTATASATVNKITTTAATSTTAATTTTTSVAVTGSANYSVTTLGASGTPAVVTLSALTATSGSTLGTSLTSGSSTALSLTVYNNGAAPTTPASVAFTTTCGQVSPTPATSNGSGVVSATYSSVNADGSLCQGSPAATVTATTSGVTSQVSMYVSAPTTGSVAFISASPTQIYLSGSGATSQATLTFKALSNTGTALANWPVDLTLTGNPGGVTFGTQGNTALVAGTTNASGLVTVSVFAGGTPGAVTIKATWNANSAIYTTSNSLSIASGPPQQRAMSLSMTNPNIEGWNIDGTTTQLTVRISDANGNAVPNGTVVNFVSSGGQINGTCTTALVATFSQCSVNFSSQAPRPTNGRVVVLAYLEGVKNYTDTNANNQYDAGTDTLSDQGDAYRDDNENGQYDSGEFVVSKGGAVVCAGAGGATPKRVNTCTGLLPTTVRAQTIILLSSNLPLVTAVAGQASFTATNARAFNFTLNGTAQALLPMPSGTSISITSSVTGCGVGTITPSAVQYVGGGTDPAANVGSVHAVALTGTAAAGATPAVTCSGAILTIQTTTPSGRQGSATVTVP